MIDLEEAEVAHDMADFLRRDVVQELKAVKEALAHAELRWVRMQGHDQALGKSMKASVKTEGPSILEAEIELNLRRGYLITSKLAKPCVLDQLLQFHRILHVQYRTVARMLSVLEKEPTPEAVSIEDLFVLVHHTFKTLTSLGLALRDAGNAVRLPSKRRFPYSSQIDHHFHPPLPSDILVDFSVHQARVLVEAFVVAPTSKPVDAALAEGHKKDFVGQITLFRGQTIEIARQTSVALELPGLEDLLVILDDQRTRVDGLRDKADALLQCSSDRAKYI
ncbi:hypothetical protein ACHHYP_04349 [Achlya hypogyna]|uniref:Uncharacterized protein n=1 Tax=Achlya hypogyna TaxID=1202772 RepID=A0A1V9Z1B6_ACHHY|nr:hypothetical protein ACHHYP_04349 [Achlya hypogyna]